MTNTSDKFSGGGGDVAPSPRSPASSEAGRKLKELQVCPSKTVSLQGCTPDNCAPFCAHPRSKTIALGSNGTGKRSARTSDKNQHHSKSSHLVREMSAATVNRRVASFEQANSSRPGVSFGVSWFCCLVHSCAPSRNNSCPGSPMDRVTFRVLATPCVTAR
jgi:hypothetical protein